MQKKLRYFFCAGFGRRTRMSSAVKSIPGEGSSMRCTHSALYLYFLSTCTPASCNSRSSSGMSVRGMRPKDPHMRNDSSVFLLLTASFNIGNQYVLNLLSAVALYQVFA